MLRGNEIVHVRGDIFCKKVWENFPTGQRVPTLSQKDLSMLYLVGAILCKNITTVHHSSLADKGVLVPVF